MGSELYSRTPNNPKETQSLYTFRKLEKTKFYFSAIARVTSLNLIRKMEQKKIPSKETNFCKIL